jgi:hypothetical protein
LSRPAQRGLGNGSGRLAPGPAGARPGPTRTIHGLPAAPYDGYLSLRAFTHSDKLLSPIISKAQLPHDNFRHIVDYAVDVARRAANNPEPCVFCPPIALFNGRKGFQAREQDLLRGLASSVECDDHPNEAMQQLEEILGEATVVVRSGGQRVQDQF